MKKLLIATAIAASIASTAQAFDTYTVTSNITGVELWIPLPGSGDIDLQSTTGASDSGLTISGYAYDTDSNGSIDDSQLAFTGTLQFDPGTVPIRVTFNLSGGAFAAGQGVTFTAGTIQVDAYSGGWQPFGTIVVDPTNNIPFLVGTNNGHLGTNDTTGLQLNAAGVTLPGLYTSNVANVDRAVSALTLLGNPAGLFLAGTLSFSQPGYP